MVRGVPTVVNDPLRLSESRDSGIISANSHAGKRNRCSCGNVIVKINDVGSSSLTSVFDRLYNDHVKKEMNHRVLSAKQIEKEARECTYIPLTNNIRRQLSESNPSFDGSMAKRERRVEVAREQYRDGKICVDCMKKVEIGTGTFQPENLLGEDASLRSEEDGSTFLPREIFLVDDAEQDKSTKKSKRKPPRVRPPRAGRPGETLHVETAGRDERTDESNPREIPSNYSSDNDNSFSRYRSRIPHYESRNDESTGRSKPALPPLGRHATHNKHPSSSAFSFDMINNAISSLASEESVSRLTLGVSGVPTLGSHETPQLRNTAFPEVREQPEEVQAKDTLTSDGYRVDSTSSNETSLKLVTYVGVNNELPQETPKNLPTSPVANICTPRTMMNGELALLEKLSSISLVFSASQDDADVREEESAMGSTKSQHSSSNRSKSILDCEEEEGLGEDNENDRENSNTSGHVCATWNTESADGENNDDNEDGAAFLFDGGLCAADEPSKSQEQLEPSYDETIEIDDEAIFLCGSPKAVEENASNTEQEQQLIQAKESQTLSTIVAASQQETGWLEQRLDQITECVSCGLQALYE